MFAIIPARSGSKRIKRKNIKVFRGKPIIYWVLKELKKNKHIKKIIVTSDDPKILRLSKKYGADILIKRSKKISNDYTPFQIAINDAIKNLKISHKHSKVLAVFPCSAFIKNEYIVKATNLLKKNPTKFIIGVSKYSHPIQRAYQMKKNFLKYFNKRYELTRTQDIKESFYDAGQFCLGNSTTWQKRKVQTNALGIIIPRERAIDIDTIEDWKFAEKLSKIIL